LPEEAYEEINAAVVVVPVVGGGDKAIVDGRTMLELVG